MSSVCLDWFEDENGVGCYLGMLTVEPTSQTGGVGKQMMAAAEAAARAWGARRMTLGVINFRTELMAWYERRGYRKTGEILPFPYGDTRFGEPKRDDLHFVMFSKSL
jgi:GNAT superfamily N-acetyltransferase